MRFYPVISTAVYLNTSFESRYFFFCPYNTCRSRRFLCFIYTCFLPSIGLRRCIRIPFVEELLYFYFYLVKYLIDKRISACVVISESLPGEFKYLIIDAFLEISARWLHMTYEHNFLNLCFELGLRRSKLWWRNCPKFW